MPESPYIINNSIRGPALPPESFGTFTSELLQNYQPLEKLETRQFESFRDDHSFILWLINDKKISPEEIKEVVRRDVLAIMRYKSRKRDPVNELPTEIDMPQTEMASLTEYFEALAEHNLLNAEQLRMLREGGSIFSNILINIENKKSRSKLVKEQISSAVKEIDTLTKTTLHYRMLLGNILNQTNTKHVSENRIWISTAIPCEEIGFILRDDALFSTYLSEKTLAFLSNFPFLKKFLPVPQRRQTGVHVQTNNLQSRPA